MVAVTIHRQLDYANISIGTPQLESYSGNHITVSAYPFSGTFYGTFVYGSAGLTEGTVTGYREYFAGDLVYEVNGGTFPATTLFTITDPAAILAYVLSGSDVVTGSASADTIAAGAGSDTIRGGEGNDVLAGEVGNDTLRGEAGNDTLVGGDGTDVVVFSGTRSDYRIGRDVAVGAATVVDQRAGGDGSDALIGIETLQFADQTVSLGDVRSPVLTAAGAQVGNGGTQVTLTFDETLDASGVSASCFAVSSGGSPIAVTAVSVAGGVATLTLGAAIEPGAAAAITYSDPAGDQVSGVLQDLAANDAASFSSVATRAGEPTGPVVAVTQSRIFYTVSGSSGSGVYGFIGTDLRADSNVRIDNSTFPGVGNPAPQAGLLADGRIAVVDQNGRQVNVVILDRSGAVAERFDSIGAASDFDVTASLAVVGDSIVVGHGAWREWFTVINYPTKAIAAPVLYSQNSGSWEMGQTTYSLGSSGFLAGWDDRPYDIAPGGYFFRKYDALGVSQGGAFKLDDTWQSYQQSPSVAMLSPDRYGIAWVNANVNSSNADIFLQKYDLNNAKIGAKVAVTANGAVIDIDPSMSVGRDGTILLAWNRENSIYARTFTQDLSPISPEVLVSAGKAPRVMALDDGFVVAWIKDDSKLMMASLSAGPAVGVSAPVQVASVSQPAAFNNFGSPPSLLVMRDQMVTVGGGGDTISISFDRSLASGSIPESAFSVIAGGTVLPVVSALVSGDSVVLGLDAIIGRGMAVSVGYNDPVGDQTVGVLQDASGKDAASFAGLGAINNSTQLNLSTPGADSLSGSPSGDILKGLGGDDVISGAGGDDTLVGGAGNDTLTGGDGIDIAVFEHARTNYALILAPSGVLSVQAVSGTDRTDALAGIETLRFADGDVATEGLGILVGTAGNDTLMGTPSADTIYGLGGADTLNGGRGDDTLRGGDGNDLIDEETGPLPVGLLGPQSVRLANGETRTYFHNGLEPSIRNAYASPPDPSGDVYSQSYGVDGTAIGPPEIVNATRFHTQYYPVALAFDDGSYVLCWSQSQYGGSFAAVYQRFGALGEKIGGESALITRDDPVDTKTLLPGLGNAFTIVCGRTNENFGVAAVSYQAPAAATVSGGQDLIFGDAGDDTLRGGTNADTLDGGSGNDSLDGGDGADTLSGGVNNDTLNGGLGTDVAVYGLQRSSYTVTWIDADTMTVSAISGAEGTDTVTGVETLRFADGDVSAASTAASLSVASPIAAVAEGSSGSAEASFTVTRSGDASGPASALWSVVAAAPNPANPRDFTGNVLPSGSVSFAAGETSKTIGVSIAGDTEIEPDEAFALTLSSATGATLGTASAVATIRNDDFDTRAPQLQTGGVRFNATGTQATLTFDEALAASSVTPSGFAVNVGGQVIAVTGAAVSGSTATLSLGSALAAGASADFTYTDPAGDQTSGVLQDSAGNDVASFSASATRAAAPSGLSGMAYHWKSHALLSGVTVSVTGDGRAPGATSLLEIRGLTFDANGDARFDVFANAGAGIENFGLDLRVGGTAAVSWTEASIANWTLVTETGAGQLTLAGFGLSALTGEVKLGSVLVDLAAGSDQVRVDVLSGEIGDALVPVFSETLATKTTAATGTYALSDVADDVVTMSLARGTADTGSAINSQDALAALKIAVGRNPNADPDGSGPLQPNVVSPYQFIAADVTGDGRVNSQDALAILKMAVRRADAPARDWIFVREDADFWNEAMGAVSMNRNAVSYAKSPFAVSGGAQDLDFVGVLKGDVNGSWAGGSGAQTLPQEYFASLAQSLGVSVEVWG